MVCIIIVKLNSKFLFDYLNIKSQPVGIDLNPIISEIILAITLGYEDFPVFFHLNPAPCIKDPKPEEGAHEPKDADVENAFNCKFYHRVESVKTQSRYENVKDVLYYANYWVMVFHLYFCILKYLLKFLRSGVLGLMCFFEFFI